MRIFCLAAAFALPACDQGQPVPTATENQQLDDAAEMLDDAPEDLANVSANELEAGNPGQ